MVNSKKIILALLIGCFGITAFAQTEQDTVIFKQTPNFVNDSKQQSKYKPPDQFDKYVELNQIVYLSDSNVTFITFYDNWDRMYKAKVIGLSTGVAAGVFSFAGSLVQSNNAAWNANNPLNKKNGHIALYVAGGACGIVALVCTIINITETKKIRDKHGRINFTKDGVIINLGK